MPKVARKSKELFHYRRKAALTALLNLSLKLWISSWPQKSGSSSVDRLLAHEDLHRIFISCWGPWKGDFSTPPPIDLREGFVQATHHAEGPELFANTILHSSAGYQNGYIRQEPERTDEH